MVGLDPKSQNFFKGLMRSHCEAGNAVFFHPHPEVAERICDRIGISSRRRRPLTVEEINQAGHTLMTCLHPDGR